MRTLNHECELCVVGGGIAGICTALSAARHGVKTVLVQDRAMLGGNASSEMRVWICGAHGEDNRETGIVEELMLENYYQNPGMKYSIWDAMLFEKVYYQENLTLLLNTSCLDAKMKGKTISEIKAWQSNCETWHKIKAKYFADCSGDSILSTLTGAEYTYGREARSKYGEKIEPETADKCTMGMSVIIEGRETDHPVKFTPPKHYTPLPDDDAIPFREHDFNNNFWWLELGGTGDCLHDVDKYRPELLKLAFGAFDHMKNRGDHGAENWELEWIGMTPGKRESRRYIGDYVVNQNDVEAGGKFPDIIAYAGWSMDDHFPEGFEHKDSYPTIFHPAPSPWGIPWRSVYSKNIKNLLFAGRNISVSHAALSSSRVIATCGVLGQAVGTAVAQMLCDGVDMRHIDVKKLQQTLLHDDCYIPFISREVSPLSKSLDCSDDIVRNGIDRGEGNLWKGKAGDFIEYKSEKPFSVKNARIVFDSDLNREYDNMPGHYPIHTEKYVLPKTLVRDFTLLCTAKDGKTTEYKVENNCRRFVNVALSGEYVSVKLIPTATVGDEYYRVFSFEIE